jgi:hypothetical protein
MLQFAKFDMNAWDMVILSYFMYKMKLRRHCLKFNSDERPTRMWASHVDLMLVMIMGTTNNVNLNSSKV